MDKSIYILMPKTDYDALTSADKNRLLNTLGIKDMVDTLMVQYNAQDTYVIESLRDSLLSCPILLSLTWFSNSEIKIELGLE